MPPIVAVDCKQSTNRDLGIKPRRFRSVPVWSRYRRRDVAIYTSELIAKGLPIGSFSCELRPIERKNLRVCLASILASGRFRAHAIDVEFATRVETGDLQITTFQHRAR
jgi:hypothetical protein